MAQPRMTSKMLMEKNIAFGVKALIQETERHQNGKAEDKGDFNIYKVMDAIEVVSRHPNIPLETLSKMNPEVAEFFTSFFYHGTHALQKLDEHLKIQPADAATEELLTLAAEMYDKSSLVPNNPRKDFKDRFIDVDKADGRIQTLHHFMDAKKGRRAALYLQAAIDMNWLERPSYNALVAEFPNIGKESNINDYLMHPTDKDKIGEACQVLTEYYSQHF